MENVNAIEMIENQIHGHNVLLYMKGTPDVPQCGFSATVVRILKSRDVKFTSVNILEHPDIRATLPTYANWPTFPQLYVQGELIGGCDIVVELDKSGELLEILTLAKACDPKAPA